MGKPARCPHPRPSRHVIARVYVTVSCDEPKISMQWCMLCGALWEIWLGRPARQVVVAEETARMCVKDVCNDQLRH